MAGQNEVKAGEEKTMATQVGHWCEYRMEKQEAFIYLLAPLTDSEHTCSNLEWLGNYVSAAVLYE